MYMPSIQKTIGGRCCSSTGLLCAIAKPKSAAVQRVAASFYVKSPEDPAHGCQKQPSHAVLQDVDGLNSCITRFCPHKGWQQNDSSLSNDICCNSPLELLHETNFALELHLILKRLGLVSVFSCMLSMYVREYLALMLLC